MIFCAEFCVDGTISVAALHGPFDSHDEAYAFGVSKYLDQANEGSEEDEGQDGLESECLYDDEWGRVTDRNSGEPIFQIVENELPGSQRETT